MAGASPERLAPLAMLERLVSFDTESQKSNLPLIAFVEDYLRGHGVEIARSANAEGDKASILATIGPRTDGGVVLSGHTDVVPVAGQAWTSDPYRLRVENGRAYGRGAVDMKAFGALALALVPEMLATPLRRPIHILLSYDEETTCLGPVELISRFGHDLPRPSAVIVGAPPGLEIADAHKSITTFRTTVHGHAAHSSKPALGAHAIAAAADMVAGLSALADEFVERGDETGRFDPPYTTVHVGTIAGGNARNILAKTCTFHWEYRGLPGLDPAVVSERVAALTEAALARLNRHGPFGRIETECEVEVPGLYAEPGSEAERLAMKAAGRNATITVPYATEAGRFQAAGLPTVVCGPGSIDQAHQPDEYISLADLAAGESFMRRLIAECR